MMTLVTLAETCTPTPLTDVPDLREELAEDFAGWVAMREEPPADLDPWAAQHLELLEELSALGLAAVGGDTLVHGDVRADNMLVRPDGSIVLVDWPWAARGAAWVDSLLLLVNVELGGGRDVDAALAASTVTSAASPEALTGFLAGVTALFLDRARRPAPLGLPTVRAFQRAQGESTLRWLRRRLG